MKHTTPLMALLAATASIAFVASASAQNAPLKSNAHESELADAVHMPAAAPDMDMKKVLDTLAGLKGKPIEELSAKEARLQPTPADATKKVMAAEGLNPNDTMGVTTKDLTIPGKGGAIPARVYFPPNANAGAPLPVIVYYHGGGWVIADLDTYDATPRAMAKQVNAIVVSSHYRQAPEHKFPAAHEDAISAYEWTLKNAASWHGDPKRVAVMGESAGANLAINTAIAARDMKIQQPVHEVLIYPVAGVDMTTPSYKDNANAKPLNKPMMSWFVKNVVNSDKDTMDPRIDLNGKADLKGLPPTTVITAEIDPLRSEGQTLIGRLKTAGVKVDSSDYKGVTHEFFGMAPVVADAKAAQKVVADDLKAAFGNTTASVE